MWTNETIEATMDVVEKGNIYPWGQHLMGHSLNSFSFQLNGKARSMKMGSIDVLIEKEDVTMIL
jgi:hypothetical protein